jgi:4-carboxymuconolactone decarboxylase
MKESSRMVEPEKQAFIDKMYRERGYLLDFHKVLVAEDFTLLKAYDRFIEAAKELLYTTILTAARASVDQIKLHVRLALEAGASKKEILEALEMCIPAAGVPVFMVGFEAWKQVVSPERVEPSSH